MDWQGNGVVVEDLDWRRQLEQLAETQHRNEKLAESRTKQAEDAE